jgi:hypothetical protein
VVDLRGDALSSYIVIFESAPEVVQVVESAPEVVQVFSDLTINNIGGSTADLVLLNPAVPGLGGTVQSAVVALNIQAQPKQWIFGDADLSVDGFFVVNHGLSTVPSSHEVYFPNGMDLDIVYPEVAVKNTIALSLDFNGFRPIPNGSKLIVR